MVGVFGALVIFGIATICVWMLMKRNTHRKQKKLLEGLEIEIEMSQQKYKTLNDDSQAEMSLVFLGYFTRVARLPATVPRRLVF